MIKDKIRLSFLIFFCQLTTTAFAATDLSEECKTQLDKIGETTIRLLDGSEYNGPAGINSGEIKELAMVKHPFEKRLKYRVFEVFGGLDRNEYRIRFILSFMKNGGCSIDGMEIFHVSPVEQEDRGIKYHNDNLK
jgi:hypothetical protein